MSTHSQSTQRRIADAFPTSEVAGASEVKKRGRPIGKGAKELLSDVKLRSAKKKVKPYKLFDGGGLFLLVSASGSKLWRFKYSLAGKERLAALGEYPDVSLVEARERARAARALVEQGRDPVQQARIERAKASTTAATTFEILALEWLEKQRPRLAAVTADKAKWILERHVFPEIGRLPLEVITTPILHQAIGKLEKRGKFELAKRALMNTTKVFAYAVKTGRAEHNPAESLRGTLTTGVVKSRAALPSQELGECMRRIDAYDGQPATRIGLRLLALTFVRPGELRAAPWAEFDCEGEEEWKIPAERMKMSVAHWVPLSRQALVALEELHSIACYTHIVSTRIAV